MLPRRVPRALRYNGETKITRTINTSLPYTTLGFGLGATFFGAVNIVFDPTGVTVYGNSTTFQNTPLVNAAEISALYDQMKIDKVVMTWSNNSSAISNGGANFRSAKYLVCNDSNDGIGSANIDEIRQQPNKSFLDNEGQENTWTCYPKFQRVIYQTALVSNYEPTTGFVNSNSTIPHYGIKMAISNLSSLSASTTETVDIAFKYFLSLKNVK